MTAIVSASAALLGSLIPTVINLINNKEQRKFDRQLLLLEKQKDFYLELLLTLEETMSSPSLEQIAELQRAVLKVATYGDIDAAKAAVNYFSNLINSELSDGQSLSRDEHQRHHEAILGGIRKSLGLESLPAFELVQISRSAKKK